MNMARVIWPEWYNLVVCTLLVCMASATLLLLLATSCCMQSTLKCTVQPILANAALIPLRKVTHSPLTCQVTALGDIVLELLDHFGQQGNVIDMVWERCQVRQIATQFRLQLKSYRWLVITNTQSTHVRLIGALRNRMTGTRNWCLVVCGCLPSKFRWDIGTLWNRMTGTCSWCFVVCGCLPSKFRWDISTLWNRMTGTCSWCLVVCGCLPILPANIRRQGSNDCLIQDEQCKSRIILRH